MRETATDGRSLAERLFWRLLSGAVYATAFCVAYEYGGTIAVAAAAGFSVGSLNERLGDIT